MKADPSGVLTGAHFLDGEREATHRVRMLVDYEPITDLFLIGAAEWTSATNTYAMTTRRDVAVSIQVKVGY